MATPIDVALSGRAQRLRMALRRRTGEHWEPTDALRRGLLVGVGLVAFGALWHRLDVLLIGAPLLLATLVGLTGRPSGPVVVRPLPAPRLVDVVHDRQLSVEVDCGGVAEVLALRLPQPGRGGAGRVHVLPAGRFRLTCSRGSDGWGEAIVLRTDHLLAGRDCLMVYGPVVGAATRQVVLPPVDPLPAGPLPPRAAGLVGAHRSRRPGDSTELRAIRPFAPGDRLRRVDWRVSLRAGFPHSGALHVRERHADADADVVLALDTGVDVGAALGDWASVTPSGRAFRTGSGHRSGPASSLDTAVRAAASLAASYLQQGDRVGLADLGRPQLYLKPGSGVRQLLRLRHRLVLCARSAGWSPRPVLAQQLVPAGAMVAVLSPFLDDAVAQLAVVAARRGNLVVAIDVLPQPLVADPETPWGEAVLALVRAERRARLDGLASHGVPVLRWTLGEPATAAATLHRLTSGRRPRLIRAGR
ncbi:MAG TPA: DUF58 domain-containing protein [Pseudonocardiaceae bacterium]|jgi:uncharacterized protein (DUF58 family)